MFGLFKKQENIKKNPYQPTEVVGVDRRNQIYNELDLLRRDYEDIVIKHQTYSSKIDELYKKAIYQEAIENNFTEECIELCVKDIELAPTLAVFYKKEQNLMNSAYGHKNEEDGFGIPVYSSFVRISQLYEKRKMYTKALGYVQQALSLGFKNDGSKAGMEIREMRLQKKISKK